MKLETPKSQQSFSATLLTPLYFLKQTLLSCCCDGSNSCLHSHHSFLILSHHHSGKQCPPCLKLSSPSKWSNPLSFSQISIKDHLSFFSFMFFLFLSTGLIWASKYTQIYILKVCPLNVMQPLNGHCYSQMGGLIWYLHLFPYSSPSYLFSDLFFQHMALQLHWHFLCKWQLIAIFSEVQGKFWMCHITNSHKLHLLTSLVTCLRSFGFK